MKKTDTHAFVNQLLVCVLVTISCGGSIGLGTVWMRHQISLTANENRRLTARIAEIDRALGETKALVSEEESIEALSRRNRDWHLGLNYVEDQRLVRVTEDPVRRLAARNSRELTGVRVAFGQ